MKKPVVILLALLLGGVFASPSLESQQVDLVKLRKKEKERREKLKQQKKKRARVTDSNVKDMAESKNKPGYAESGSDSGKKKEGQEEEPAVKPLVSVDGADKGSQPEVQDEQTTAEYWQRLKRGLDERIADLENRLSQNESRLNLLHTQYLGQDLPMEKRRIKTELDNLKESDKQDRERLAQLRRELEELRDRARKAGVPPGWLR